MDKGLFGVATVMVSMLPEEFVVDRALEALQVYKLTGGAKPRTEIVMLLQKWMTEGMSTEEIIKTSKKVEDIHTAGKNIVDFGEN